MTEDAHDGHHQQDPGHHAPHEEKQESPPDPRHELPDLPPSAVSGDFHHQTETGEERASSADAHASLDVLSQLHVHPDTTTVLHPLHEIPGHGVFGMEPYHHHDSAHRFPPSERSTDRHASTWALDPHGAHEAISDGAREYEPGGFPGPLGGNPIVDALHDDPRGNELAATRLWSALMHTEPPRNANGEPAAPLEVLRALSERVEDPMVLHVIELAIRDAQIAEH